MLLEKSCQSLDQAITMLEWNNCSFSFFFSYSPPSSPIFSICSSLQNTCDSISTKWIFCCSETHCRIPQFGWKTRGNPQMSPPSNILGEYCANILEYCKGARVERAKFSRLAQFGVCVCGMLKMLMKSKSRRERERERKGGRGKWQQAEAEVFYVLSSSST